VKSKNGRRRGIEKMKNNGGRRRGREKKQRKVERN
jgi:hypothetical protein